MNLVAANILVGISLNFLGFWNGGAWLIASWLGVGFFLTGVGYAINKPEIYGKNDKGGFPFWALLIYLPFFLYFLIMWHWVQWLIRENAFDWVTDTIIIGRRLSRQEYPECVENYVDLTAEFYEPKAVIDHVNYIFLPILDGNIPDIQQLNAAFDKLSNGITYIHCGQGHGRTGLFTALLLAKQGRVSTPEEALAFLKSKRPKLALTAKQKAFVRTIMEQY
jgi:hypothetical protein